MHIEDGRVYFDAHDEDVLNNATLQEAKHRLEGDRRLLWEAIGPDALPKDPIEADDLETDIATALVSDAANAGKCGDAAPDSSLADYIRSAATAAQQP